MMTITAFEAFVQKLAHLNQIDEQTAGEYAVKCADTPELDKQERAIIRDCNGIEIARVIVPMGD